MAPIGKTKRTVRRPIPVAIPKEQPIPAPNWPVPKPIPVEIPQPVTVPANK